MATPVSGPLPPFRTQQAANSKTFTPPPLDYSVVLPQFFDHHRRHSADHTFYIYDNEDGTNKTISWGTYGRALHRGVKAIQGHVEKGGLTESAETPVFGILSAAGKFPNDFMSKDGTHLLAIVQIILPISLRSWL